MIKKIIFLLVASFLLGSCANKKDILYYQDVVENSQNQVQYLPNKVQVNDILYIKVVSIVPESVEPFNIQLGSSNAVSPSLLKLQGYLVLEDGTIAFPVLGNIKVKGFSVVEIQDTISKLLLDRGYVKDPTVNVRIINSKVTILGEVNSPGTFNFEEQTISLNQAIGNAGGLTMNGVRKDVLLIREVDGVRTFTRLDLTKSDLFNSPYYYVKPNDVIIVNPNGPRILTAGYITNLGSFIGILSFGIGLFLLLKR